MKYLIVLAMVATVFAVTACGKRADIQPPVDYIQPERSY